jgi:hypothetical protein
MKPRSYVPSDRRSETTSDLSVTRAPTVVNSPLAMVSDAEIKTAISRVSGSMNLAVRIVNVPLVAEQSPLHSVNVSAAVRNLSPLTLAISGTRLTAPNRVPSTGDTILPQMSSKGLRSSHDRGRLSAKHLPQLSVVNMTLNFSGQGRSVAIWMAMMPGRLVVHKPEGDRNELGWGRRSCPSLFA